MLFRHTNLRWMLVHHTHKSADFSKIPWSLVLDTSRTLFHHPHGWILFLHGMDVKDGRHCIDFIDFAFYLISPPPTYILRAVNHEVYFYIIYIFDTRNPSPSATPLRRSLLMGLTKRHILHTPYAYYTYHTHTTHTIHIPH